MSRIKWGLFLFLCLAVPVIVWAAYGDPMIVGKPADGGALTGLSVEQIVDYELTTNSLAETQAVSTSGFKTVVSLKDYSIVSDATVSSGVVSGTNGVSALISAYNDGYRQFFIPKNTRIKLNSGSFTNTIPAGVTIYGEEWDTVFLETTTPNSNQLTIGVDTILYNVAVYSKFGYDLLADNNMPHSYNEPRPVRMYANNTGVARQVSNWYKGNVHAEQGQGSGSPTSSSNYPHYDWPANSVANYGSGDSYWAGATWNSSCFRADVAGGRGFYAPLGSTFPSGKTYPGGTAVPAYGVLVETVAGGVFGNTYMIYATARTDNPGLDIVPLYNTTRDIYIRDVGAKTSGNGLDIYYGSGFTGKFARFYTNSVEKFSVNHAGSMYAAGGVNAGAGGVYTSAGARADSGLSVGTSSSSDGVRVLSTSPGFWLEDSSGGGSSINFVNDGGYFQIQERSTGFEGFLKNLMYIQVSSGNTCIYGNLTSGATCDFVFGQDHKVPTIEEVDKNIKQYNKLPGLEEPEGISMRDLMIKTEEQALYIIQLNNKLKDLEKQFVLFSARLAALEKKE